MQHNVGRLDQFFRIFIGMALVAYVLKVGKLMPYWPLVGLFGGALLVTAAFSYCPVYEAFKTSSQNQSDRTI